MKIHFFGCSFTEGSGLDRLEYYNNKTNSNILDYSKNNQELLQKFKQEHRYTNVVKQLMNCEVNNYAIGCNSNENILNKLFEILNCKDISSEDVFIVQLSIFSRKYVWYEPTSTFYNVNGLDITSYPYDGKNEMIPLKNFYELNMKYSHNEEYEINKILMYIDLFNSYCKEKNIKIFWMPWPEMSTKLNFDDFYQINKKLKNKNLIFFKNLSMGTFITYKNYTIKDEYSDINDGHMSLEGHKLIVNMIVDILNEKL